MGKLKGFEFEILQQIWDEVWLFWLDGVGLVYVCLECEDFYWLCLDEMYLGIVVLYWECFFGSKIVVLVLVVYVFIFEQISDVYFFLLIIGWVLYYFNVGMMSYCIFNVVLKLLDMLDMVFVDVVCYGLVEGDMVEVLSWYGVVILLLCISDVM